MGSNAHRGLTGDLVTDALDIAGALFWKRTQFYSNEMFDREAEEQDFKTHILRNLHSYNPAKGAITTWVYIVWGTWWAESARRRIAIAEHELRFDSTPGSLDEVSPGRPTLAEQVNNQLPPEPRSLEITGKARELLELIPERMHEALITHLADGASLRATAERHGVSDRTISRWVREARETWSAALAAA